MADDRDNEQEDSDEVLTEEIRRHFEESYEENRAAMERLAEL